MLPTVPQGSKVTQQCDLGKLRKVPLKSRNIILIPMGNEHTVLSVSFQLQKLKKSSLFSVQDLPDSSYEDINKKNDRTHFLGVSVIIYGGRDMRQRFCVS